MVYRIGILRRFLVIAFNLKLDFVKLEENIWLFDWSCLLNRNCALFTNKVMEFVNACIPYKAVVIRPNDKPTQKLGNSLENVTAKKPKQLESHLKMIGIKYNNLRNKVNNLKKHAKETFHNNLELSLLTSFNDNKKTFGKLSNILCLRKLQYHRFHPFVQRMHLVTKRGMFLMSKSLNEVLENINVTEEEINDIMLNLDPNKTSGPDLISNKMSRLMGKPTICIGENKGADQLRGNREADQRLCFRYLDSTIPLLLDSKISSF